MEMIVHCNGVKYIFMVFVKKTRLCSTFLHWTNYDDWFENTAVYRNVLCNINLIIKMNHGSILVIFSFLLTIYTENHAFTLEFPFQLLSNAMHKLLFYN